MFLYNFGLKIIMMSFRIVWASKFLTRFLAIHKPKVCKFIQAQNGVLDIIKSEMSHDSREVYWFHAASFGEYNVIRPIIKQLYNEGRYNIVITFFSPSGYEALKDLNIKDKGVDHIFYLPLDTKSNVTQFLDIIHPKKAIFAISEYWMNYLNELKSRQISTYIVSMLVGRDSYLLSWYAFPIRKALSAVKVFMVSDEESKANLKKIGFTNAVIIGDPLFDNAIRIKNEPYKNDIIEHFCLGANGVFIAGSISDNKDLSLVSDLANVNRDTKFIIVPHQISEEILNNIIYHLDGKARLYSECESDTDYTETQVLIIDFMGSLSYIYRYGRWGYVGGGFTPYLHSIIEPVVYGIPVSFGPRIERKRTPNQLIRLGIGGIVRTKKGMRSWFENLKDEKRLSNIKDLANKYIEDNSNVTDKIIQIILE